MSIKNRLSTAVQGGSSKRLLILGGVVIGIAAFVFFMTPSDDRVVESQVRQIPNSEPTVQGKQEVTPAMDAELSKADQQRIDEASEKGGSAIPTIRMGNASALELDVGGEADRDLLIPDRPEPPQMERPVIAAIPVNSEPVRPVALAEPERENPHLKGVTDFFGKLPTPTYERAAVTYLYDPKTAEAAAAAPAAGPSGAAVASIPSVSGPPAGEIVYARMISEANSDAPGPVLAEILQGEYKGSRLVGRFKANRDNLVLEFRTMTVKREVFGEKRDETVRVAAVAVDAATVGNGVATSVDYHLVQNVGIGLAAAFAEGFGKAAANVGSDVTTGSGGITIATRGLDVQEQLYAAGGEAAAVAGDNLTSLFGNRPPTIKVAAGTPIGVFFLGDGAVR